MFAVTHLVPNFTTRRNKPNVAHVCTTKDIKFTWRSLEFIKSLLI